MDQPNLSNLANPEVPSNLDELLELARPELDTYEGELVRRAIGRDRVLELTTVVRTSWAGHEHRFGAELSEPRAAERQAQLAGLDRRAWVFYAADLRVNASYTNVSEIDKAALAVRVQAHDQRLMGWALPLFGGDPLRAEALRAISRGRGRRDDADDVLELVGMYRASWDQVEGQSRITAEYIAEAEAEAKRQLELMQPGAGSPADLLMRRAYCLWYDDYRDLVKLGRFLWDGDNDLLERFPGVRASSVGRNSTSPATAQSSEAGEGAEAPAPAEL